MTENNMPRLVPVGEQVYRIEPATPAGGKWDFAKTLEKSIALEREGSIEQACNMRYGAFQLLMELLPDEGECSLDWEDETSQAALLMISYSAIDHFLVGDFEMCAGMLELLLELDPEDHLEATKNLAYCYVALEQYELFDEIINDISDKYPEKGVLRMWSEFRRQGALPEGEYIHFKKSFPVYLNEFTADDHPADADYIKAIDSHRPPKEALARELWLQTEHLWQLYPEFISALKKKG